MTATDLKILDKIKVGARAHHSARYLGTHLALAKGFYPTPFLQYRIENFDFPKTEILQNRLASDLSARFEELGLSQDEEEIFKKYFLGLDKNNKRALGISRFSFNDVVAFLRAEDEAAVQAAQDAVQYRKENNASNEELLKLEEAVKTDEKNRIVPKDEKALKGAVLKTTSPSKMPILSREAGKDNPLQRGSALYNHFLTSFKPVFEERQKMVADEKPDYAKDAYALWCLKEVFIN